MNNEETIKTLLQGLASEGIISDSEHMVKGMPFAKTLVTRKERLKSFNYSKEY